jgi:hypothetical protein
MPSRVRRSLVLASVVAWAVLVPTAMARGDRDRYENPALGFALTKPANWHFVTTQQHRENLGRVAFSSETSRRQVVEQSSAPLLVAMRHRDPVSGINPSLRVTMKPFAASASRDPLTVSGVILAGVAKQLGEIELVQPPEAATVAGLPAAHAVLHYTLRTTDGGASAAASELWVVPHGGVYYVIGAGYARGDDAIRAQVRAAVDSIALGER